MGLFHPFQVYGLNDEIADTPPMGDWSSFYYNTSMNFFECPIGADSVLNHAGLDPIHNFMAYTSDCCLYTFTEDQKLRMHFSWKAFRSNNSPKKPKKSKAGKSNKSKIHKESKKSNRPKKPKNRHKSR